MRVLTGAQFGSDNFKQKLDAYQHTKYICLLENIKNYQKGGEKDKVRVMSQ